MRKEAKNSSQNILPGPSSSFSSVHYDGALNGNSSTRMEDKVPFRSRNHPRPHLIATAWKMIRIYFKHHHRRVLISLFFVMVIAINVYKKIRNYRVKMRQYYFKPSITSRTARMYHEDERSPLITRNHIYNLPYPPYMFDAEYTLHVFIPTYNGEDHILECIESVLRQTFVRYHVWIYDDGSTDNTDGLLRMKYGAEKRITLLRNKSNLGSAYTKWIGFQEIAKTANPNDIVFQLDGEDYLMYDEALALVHNEYTVSKCWFTYGPYDGPFSVEVRHMDLDSNVDFRSASWIYGPPRTFKAFLIDYLSESDFMQADGTWLTKGTDRGFVYRFLELSGRRRISYMHTHIYYYRKHGSDRWSIVSKESKAEQLRHITSLPTYLELQEEIHVFAVTSGNKSVLSKFIESITTSQTVSYRIKLHIWNNDVRAKDQIDAVAKAFPKLKIDVIHSGVNFGGFGAFIHIKKEMTRSHVDYAIIADENLDVFDDYVEKLYDERQPQSSVCWYGKYFPADFHSRAIPSVADLVSGRRSDVMTFHIVDTKGCVMDASLFLMPAALVFPRRYIAFDDIWLSYVLRASRWDMRRTLVRPKSSPEYAASRDSSRPQALREEFLSYIRTGGWDVL